MPPQTQPPSPSMDPFHLRSLTTTLTSTPEPGLPSEIAAIVSTLYSIPILETAFHTASSKNGDTTVLLHKYKTRVSSLLQSRPPQGKWAGVALVKASVESSPEALGAWAKSWVPLVVALLGVRSPFLSVSIPQLMNLLNLLQRPEPTATLTLSLSTLSTIFNLLTPSKPTLTRELTTPNLKPFLEATLHLLSPNHTSHSQATNPPIITDSPTLLPSALRALAQTLPAHATTFRPFAKRTQSIILAILSSPPYTLTEEVESLSREILINLHLCATPSSRGAEPFEGERNTTANAISSEWARLLHCTISDLHTTLDQLFSPVLEDPSLTPESSSNTNNTLNLSHPPSDSPSAQAGRALLLLRLLLAFFTLPTTVPVTTPLLTILSLTSRILSLTPPHTHPNPTHSASSRDHLFTLLPMLHLTTLSFIDTFAQRLGELFIPAALQTITSILSLWDYVKLNSELRVMVYRVLNTLLILVGGGMPKGGEWKKVVKIAENAVDDVLRPYMAMKEDNTITVNSSASTSGKRKKSSNGASASARNSTATATLADTLLNTTSNMADSQCQPYNGNHNHPSEEGQVAITFLETLLIHLPAPRIPSELRTKIDRMAILTSTRSLLLASVLFPASYVRGSLLPFLVAGKSKGGLEEMGVQGVCWPRMPVVRVGERDEGEQGEEGEEDGEEGVEEAMDVDLDATQNGGSRVEAVDWGGEILPREERWSRALRTPITPTPTQQHPQIISPPPPSPKPQPQLQQPQHSSPAAPATPPKPPPTTTTNNRPGNDPQDTIHALPSFTPLTPSTKQLHQDMDAEIPVTPHPHPTKRVKLTSTPSASLPSPAAGVDVGGCIVGTIASRSSSRSGGGGVLEDEDEDEEMVIPEIDFGVDSDNDGDDGSDEDDGSNKSDGDDV